MDDSTCRGQKLPTTSVVLLMSPASYRARAFLSAAASIGLNIIEAIDLPNELTKHTAGALSVDFADPDAAVERLVDFAQMQERLALPVGAILAIDDRGTLIAAQASAALGIPHNDPDSALAARDKFVMRQGLAAHGVPVPDYQRFPASSDPAPFAGDIAYPCVVKPLLLSGSRGVIRANTSAECVAAFRRTRAILEASGMSANEHHILIEQFVPGFEVALEGLLTAGELQTLALFDKPDPLDGPYFEERIYVTPSRLPPEVQAAISQRTAEAAAALGLREGPVHAELRVDMERGNIWVIELAGRSIGGLCSSILEFGSGIRLEELILRHAAGLPQPSLSGNDSAAGVMMIPIPMGGMFRGVEGLEHAQQVAGVTDIEITAPLNQPIVPLPEGESYLGFIFARSDTPAHVEAALREAHERLEFRIGPVISLNKV
jgi:biotin carboxylase